MGTDERRRTLIFPAGVDRPATITPPAPVAAVDLEKDGWDAIEAAAAPLLSSTSVVPDDDDERPSGRATIPAPAETIVDAPRQPLPIPRPRRRDEEPAPVTLRGYRGEEPLPERRPDEATTRPPPPNEPVPDALMTPTEPLLPSSAPRTTSSSVPPISIDARTPLTSLPGEMARSVPVAAAPWRRTAALFASSNLSVGMFVLGLTYALRPGHAPKPRVPATAAHEHVSLALDSGAAEDLAPLDGCRVQDLARTIAPRAELGPGLDASALESGFAVGLASAPSEAVAVRLEPSSLRTAETVRLKTPWPFARVTVDAGNDPDERVDVHVDGIYARKGGVFTPDGKLLWALPGPAPKWYEPLRATTRPDGSSIVAVRRPAHFWVGIEGHGPMTAILRVGRQVDLPTLAATRDGGVVAWTERAAAGATVVASTLTTDGKRTRASAPVVLAEGMSPAVAALPSGELLLAYADPTHRVVAQRLAPDLSPRGQLLVVSDGPDAGLPAVAVDGDGRALVAYVTRGREVRATELRCR